MDVESLWPDVVACLSVFHAIGVRLLVSLPSQTSLLSSAFELELTALLDLRIDHELLKALKSLMSLHSLYSLKRLRLHITTSWSMVSSVGLGQYVQHVSIIWGHGGGSRAFALAARRLPVVAQSLTPSLEVGGKPCSPSDGTATQAELPHGLCESSQSTAAARAWTGVSSYP